MFTKLRATIIKNVRELVTDDSGRLSLAKVMLGLGFVFVSVFLWKLIMTKQLTTDILIVYVCFCSGQHLGSKALDKFGNSDDDSKS